MGSGRVRAMTDQRFPCPKCRTTLDPSRLLSATSHERPVVSGTDTEAWFVTFRVSCGKCLAVMSFSDIFGTKANLRLKGEEAARLQKVLSEARSAGNLKAQVLRILKNPDSTDALLLGMPEVFADVADALGRKFRLKEKACGSMLEHSLDSETFELPTILRSGSQEGREFSAGTSLTLVGIRNGVPRGRTEDGRELLVPLHLAAFE